MRTTSFFKSFLRVSSQISRVVALNTVCVLLALFTSCQTNVKPVNTIVKNVNMTSTADTNGDVWLSLSAQFDLGPMYLTSIDLPIVDPYVPGIKYGEIFFNPTMQGNFNQIKLSVNLSHAAKVPGGFATLPNGNPLPIGGIDQTKIVQLKIDQINARIYLALDHNLTFVGFAISIEQFDVVAKYVGGANIFLGLNINGVVGTAGLYTGSNTLQSGLGFFVDLSSVLNVDQLNDIINGVPVNPTTFAESKAMGIQWGNTYYESLNKSFKDSKPTLSKQVKINNGWNDLINKINKKEISSQLRLVPEE